MSECVPVYNELNLFHYIGESTSNEGVEEEGETGGEPLHEEGNEEQDNERVEESKDHEEPQHEEATADFNSKYMYIYINKIVIDFYLLI